MENFKSILKKRLLITGLYNAVMLILIALGIGLNQRLGLDEKALGFASGFSLGIQMVMIYFMGTYLTAIKDEGKLKILFIKENDEREKHISSCVAEKGINVIFCALILGTVISGFINKTVFFTLLSALLFSVAVKGVLKLYYNRKI